jgi:hypothetical protein
MSNPFREAAERAAEKTNIEYASKISNLTRLTDKEIGKLFPARTDKNRLMELLAIVNDSTNKNQKIIKLKKNIDTLAPVVLKLVKHLV